ncbi:MAG: hypothetical protein KDA68_24700, partial [Planctomycetaceae bacterium]|nr:hypothetical protein [Planctomycetaceae bacterium]
MPKPWYRKHDGWWYAWIRPDGVGKSVQTKLAYGEDAKDEAYAVFCELMGESLKAAKEKRRPKPPSHLLTVYSLCNLFL